MPTKNLPNQDSWGDITCQSPSSKHYHFKRQGYVGQSVLSALSQWHDTIHLQEKGRKGVFVECYCDKALSTKTIWHNNIYWNDVYWVVIDKWCHLKNLGLEDFLWAYPSTLKKINRKIIINKIYGTYFNNLLATLVMIRVLWINTSQHAYALHRSFKRPQFYTQSVPQCR